MILGSETWGASAATSQVPVSATTDVENPAEMPPDEPEIHRHNIIDTVQGSASSRIVLLARWADSFFDDPEYAVQEATARTSINQDVRFYRNLDPAYRTYVRASAVLPNLNRRFRLIFEGDNDRAADEETGDTDPNIADPARDPVDDNTLRLQYLLLQQYYLDLRLTGGVRLNESDLFVGPRIKLRTNIGSHWEANLSQRIYWYTTNNLKSQTELRFDHILGHRNLFRQAFKIDWDEQKHSSEGFRHTATSSITQPLKNNSALRYQWSSDYLTRPDPGWTSTSLSIEYRKSLWREWIIVAAAPFVTWEDQFDWNPKPGFAISFSAIFEKS